jgi:uncharacterized protein DUF6162
MTALAHEVRPAGLRLEAAMLVVATLAVIATLGFYVHQHGRNDKQRALYEWQVSAFGTLTGADQAIYNALYSAKDDIPFLYDDINQMNPPGVKFHWPTLKELQEAELPPFLEDTSWQQNGALKWGLHEPLAEGEMQGSTMYLGTDGRLPGQGSFLLVIGHVHAGFQNSNQIAIWWNAKNHVDMPGSGNSDRLILQGWQQVVPHSGANEVKRISGEGDDGVEDIIDGAFGSKP